MTNRHSPTPSPHEEDAFAPILDFVRQARGQALAAVNRELVAHYWRIGEYLSHKIAADGWGQGTIKRLADWLVAQEPGIRGFSPQNLWRMRQFHETYREDAILSPVVRELSWTHNLVILSKCSSQEERGFYLRLAVQERWTKRELERQLDGGLFERTLIAKPKRSPALREIHPGAESAFKDGYLNAVILGMPRQEIDKKFDEIVDFAEMAEFIDTPVKRYNSGMTAQPITLSETQCQSYTNTSV